MTGHALGARRDETDATVVNEDHFRRLSLLAAALADPFAFLDPSRQSLQPLTSAEVNVLAAAPGFRRPIARAIASVQGLASPSVVGDIHQRLATSPPAQLVVAALAAPRTDLHGLATLLAGAVLHKRVLALVLKQDRQRLAATLGPEGFMMAEREAVVLYRPLAGLDARTLATDVLLEPSTPPDPPAVVLFGLSVLARLIEMAEPQLHRLFRLRLPTAALTPAMIDAVATPTSVHLDLAIRLVSRRLPSWQVRIV
jgi:hypothetical protein